ncbi:MAG: sialidase family protein [Terriglobia bacterium]
MATRRQFLISATAALPALARTAEGNPVQVAAVPGQGIQPQIALDGGVLHVVYFAGDPKNGNVFYRRSKDFGKTYSPPIQVNSQQGSAIALGAIRGAQISVGKAGRVHVAWNGSDVAEPRGPKNTEGGRPGSAMLYARMNERGTAFEPQRNVMRETFGLDGGGSVTADRNGNVYVGWHGKAPGAKQGEAGRQVWIAQSRDDGGNFSAEHPASSESTGVCGCCALRLFADSRGAVYGLYRSATENVHRDIYLLHSGDTGKTFSTGLVQRWEINACPMSSMNFIETPAGVLGAWETQTQVYFAPMQRGADLARTSAIAPPGDKPKRKYPVLAHNSRGETLLAWVEGSGWQRAGTLGWQIFDKDGRPGAASTTRVDVPVWSFPAALVRPDDGFTILV